MWTMKTVKQRMYYWVLILAMVVYVVVLQAELLECQKVITVLWSDLFALKRRVLGIE